MDSVFYSINLVYFRNIDYVHIIFYYCINMDSSIDTQRIFFAITSWLWFGMLYLAKKNVRQESQFIQYIWRVEYISLPIVAIITTTQFAFKLPYTPFDLFALIIYIFAIGVFAIACFYLLGKAITRDYTTIEV
jgi:hypothetical protein